MACASWGVERNGVEKLAEKRTSPSACTFPRVRSPWILKPSTLCRGLKRISGGRGPHLPFQQLFRPHILSEDLPGAITGQGAMAQVVFKEGERRHQGRLEEGWVGSWLYLPTCTPQQYQSHLPFLPDADGACRPGSTWSSLAEGSGWRQRKSLLRTWKTDNGQAVPRPGCPPLLPERSQ